MGGRASIFFSSLEEQSLQPALKAHCKHGKFEYGQSFKRDKQREVVTYMGNIGVFDENHDICMVYLEHFV